MKMDTIDFGIKAICFQLLDSVLTPKSVAYVAGPLDSGLLFYKSLFKNQSNNNIRILNQERLTSFANKLRKQLPYLVIDPGPLRVPAWTGHDYASFFLEVVERYAKEVWFVDGWEYSNGATKEFQYCIKKGILCYDETGAKISKESGKIFIERAISYIEEIGQDASKIRSHIPQ
jgi:hypothetical protein